MTGSSVGLRTELTDRLRRVADRGDAFQQRHALLAVPCATGRRYADDHAGRLSSQISHAGFLAAFPLVLVLLTVVGIVLDGHRSLQDHIVNSALSQFPVIGSDLRTNVHQLSTANRLTLVIGLLWLFFGSLRLSRSVQTMMAEVWDIDRADLPGYRHWLPRAAAFVVVLGVGFVAGGTLAGLGAFRRLGALSPWVGLAGGLVVNILMFGAAYLVVVALPADQRSVWPGAIVGGVGWTVLQFVGAQLVNHQLRHLSSLYGTFATVLGLVWWIALGAMVSVAAAELNVVVNRDLWPRSLRPRPAPVA